VTGKVVVSGDAYGGLRSGPMFVLTHETPAPADPQVRFLSGDSSEAVATGLAAAGESSRSARRSGAVAALRYKVVTECAS
jgi:hypothetical protein